MLLERHMILELHNASAIQVHVTPMRFLACLVRDTVVILEVEDSYLLSADPHQRLGLNAVSDQKEQLVNVLNNRFYIALVVCLKRPEYAAGARANVQHFRKIAINVVES